jgi:hypothetical protein
MRYLERKREEQAGSQEPRGILSIRGADGYHRRTRPPYSAGSGAPGSPAGGVRARRGGSLSVNAKARRIVSNHLTPDELAREFDLERRHVLMLCIREDVPVYHGRIDKALFAAVVEECSTHLHPDASPLDQALARRNARLRERAGDLT